MVFDIRLKGNNKPIYMSTVRTDKHTDPVWQVKWNEDITMKDMNFYSISSDGRVTNWHLMKNKLEPEEVVKLKLVVDESKAMGESKKRDFPIRSRRRYVLRFQLIPRTYFPRRNRGRKDPSLLQSIQWTVPLNL